MERANDDVLACGQTERRELTIGPLGTVAVELERLYWQSLDEMCEREGTTVAALAENLVETVDDPDPRSLDRALRVAVLSYFRDLSALDCDAQPADLPSRVPAKGRRLRLVSEESAS